MDLYIFLGFIINILCFTLFLSSSFLALRLSSHFSFLYKNIYKIYFQCFYLLLCLKISSFGVPPKNVFFSTFSNSENLETRRRRSYFSRAKCFLFTYSLFCFAPLFFRECFLFLVFTSFWRLLLCTEISHPRVFLYLADSRERDCWRLEIWKKGGKNLFSKQYKGKNMATFKDVSSGKKAT